MKLKLLLALLALAIVSAPLHRPLHDLYIKNVVNDSIFMLTNFEGTSGGTGFVLNHTTVVDGRKVSKVMVTNSHVCNATQGDYMYAVEGKRRIPLKKIIQAEEFDLCLLTAPKGAKGLKLANNYSLGQSISIVGHPRLYEKYMSKGTIVDETTIRVGLYMGECTNEGGATETIETLMGPICVGTYDALVSDAPIQPGNSGSPVVDYFGNVVAVAFAGSSESPFSFLIPLHNINRFLGL